MYDLEVLITGSSRPQLYPYMWESFKKMCIIRQPYKVTAHEDFVFGDPSRAVVKYLEGLKEKGEIHTIDTDVPARGLGYCLNHYITQRIKSKYLFYLQEDWEFERPIDIDQITWVMDQNPNINMIFFNKIRNSGTINKQEQREYNFNGLKVCLYHAWTFLPGIWRMDFARRNWVYKSERPEAGMTSRFGSNDQRASVDYCYKNIGAFIYGPQGDSRYVRHLGNDWRMAEWRLEQGKPGGNHNSDTMDKPYMAPWVPYLERPSQRGDLAGRS